MTEKEIILKRDYTWQTKFKISNIKIVDDELTQSKKISFELRFGATHIMGLSWVTNASSDPIEVNNVSAITEGLKDIAGKIGKIISASLSDSIKEEEVATAVLQQMKS